MAPRIEQVFTFGSPSAEAILRAFSTESGTEPHGQVKVRVSGKADRAEGLPRLRDTDTSLITFREKQLSPAQTSLLPTESPDARNKGKGDAALQAQRGCVFWPQRPQKAHATRRSDPAGSGLHAEGSRSTLGIDGVFSLAERYQLPWSCVPPTRRRKGGGYPPSGGLEDGKTRRIREEEDMVAF